MAPRSVRCGAGAESSSLLPLEEASALRWSLKRACASMTCLVPNTPAARSAASTPRATSACNSLSCANDPATSNASGTTVVNSPTVIAPLSTNEPPYHSCEQNENVTSV